MFWSIVKKAFLLIPLVWTCSMPARGGTFLVKVDLKKASGSWALEWLPDPALTTLPKKGEAIYNFVREAGYIQVYSGAAGPALYSWWATKDEATRPKTDKDFPLAFPGQTFSFPLPKLQKNTEYYLLVNRGNRSSRKTNLSKWNYVKFALKDKNGNGTTFKAGINDEGFPFMERSNYVGRVPESSRHKGDKTVQVYDQGAQCYNLVVDGEAYPTED